MVDLFAAAGRGAAVHNFDTPAAGMREYQFILEREVLSVNPNLVEPPQVF